MKTYEKLVESAQNLKISLMLILEVLIEYSDNLQECIGDLGLNDLTEQELSRNKMHSAISAKFGVFSVSYLRLNHTLADRLLFCGLWDRREQLVLRRYKDVMTFCDVEKYGKQDITENLMVCLEETLEGAFLARLEKLREKAKQTKQAEQRTQADQELADELAKAELEKEIAEKFSNRGNLTLDHFKVLQVFELLQEFNEKELEQLGYESHNSMRDVIYLAYVGGQELEEKIANDKQAEVKMSRDRIEQIEKRNKLAKEQQETIEKTNTQYDLWVPYVDKMNSLIGKVQNRTKLNLRHQPIISAYHLDWNKGECKLDKRLANKIVKELVA